MINFLLFSLSVLIGSVVCLYYRYVRHCIKISSENKTRFFKLAKELFDSGDLTELQFETIEDWVRSANDENYTHAVIVAICKMREEELDGKAIKIDKETERLFEGKRILELFSYWVLGHMYTLPIHSLIVKDLLIQETVASRNAMRFEARINKTVFPNQCELRPAA